MAWDLVAAGAEKALRPTCLEPLNRLSEQVELRKSLAHITQDEAEAVRLRDVATDQIERSAIGKDLDEVREVDKPKPKFKARKVIRAADLVQGIYLGSQDEVDRFLDELRKIMEDALAKGERIEIR